MSFAEKVRSKMLARGSPRRTYPANLLEEWEFFIKQVSDGYGMCIYEFDNDLSIRNAIEEVLNDEALKQFDDYAVFASKVRDLDLTFMKLLSATATRHGDSWWYSGVPLYARAELAKDFLDVYGVSVEVTK